MSFALGLVLGVAASCGSPAEGTTAPGTAESTTDAAGASAEDVQAEGGTTYTMEVTFYGWFDNSPPGDAIAYPASAGFPTVHDVAGGTGTWDDPITMATDASELPVGTIVYAPFLQKYLVMEDDCTQCDEDWSMSMTRHIDVWMNSSASANPAALSQCEAQWTQGETPIEVNPPAGRAVTTALLFAPSTNECLSLP